MSDPLTTRLSRFTPDSSGLDREALLFAAGRASAPRARRWQILAGLLVASQLLTLVLLWPPVSSPVHPSLALPNPTIEPAPPPAPEGPLPWSVGNRSFALEGDLPAPAAIESLVPPDPPLRAFATVPVALLE
jgi:hypothetical protein